MKNTRRRYGDITGMVVNGCTALGRSTHKDKHNHALWVVKCHCGSVRDVMASSFVRIKSCGCISKQRGPGNPGWEGTDNIGLGHWTNIKKSARVRKIPFDDNLTIEDISDLLGKQSYKCKLSGMDIQAKGTYSRKFTASLDRIDSDAGYTLENLQWVHKDINRMESVFSEDRFFELCAAVIKTRDTQHVDS